VGGRAGESLKRHVLDSVQVSGFSLCSEGFSRVWNQMSAIDKDRLNLSIENKKQQQQNENKKLMEDAQIWSKY